MTVTQYGIWNTLGGQSTVAHSSSGNFDAQGAQLLAMQQAAESSANRVIFASTGTIASAYASSTATPGLAYAHPNAVYGTAPSTEAVHRSMELLYDWMNPEQQRMWATRNYFDVIGGDSGRRYRIYPPMPFNIHRLAKDSDEPDWKICFEPKDKKLPKGDILLCQKLALELDERDTLEIANQQVYHAW